MSPCFYCGRWFKNKQALRAHLQFCEPYNAGEPPSLWEKIKHRQRCYPMQRCFWAKPSPNHPCIFCSIIVKTQLEGTVAFVFSFTPPCSCVLAVERRYPTCWVSVWDTVTVSRIKFSDDLLHISNVRSNGKTNITENVRRRGVIGRTLQNKFCSFGEIRLHTVSCLKQRI